MPVYLVTPLSNNAAAIKVAVVSKVPEQDRHELQGDAGWLVYSQGTSVELSNLIGITTPEGKPTAGLGSAMVTSVGSYYGLASTAMWEWLKTRFERSA